MENSSTEDVKQLIHREMRLQNLDSLLLFISSASGFFFSFLYVFFGYIEIAVRFIPIIIFGSVIPIYIGYIRGAILLDNLEERVRGWIYLIMGVTTYIAFAIFSTANKLVGEIPSPFTEVLTGLSPFIGGFLLGFFLAKGRLTDRFVKHIFKIFNQEATTLIHHIYQQTEDSAYLLVMVIFVPLTILLSETFTNLEMVFLLLVSLFIVTFIFISSERTMRDFTILNKHSEFLEVERKLIRSSKHGLKTIGLILLIIGATLFGFAPIIEILTAFTSRMIAVGFLLVGSIMLIFSKEEHIIIPNFKKDMPIPKEVKKEIELVFERMKLKK